ncbi:MAG: MFS transporter, partial [Trueperaceae bacterium]|nr:MFS transporter [Trueperaceae bacterium]
MKQRLSLREKLGYGSADIGASLSYVAINTWLLYFLINVVGLEPLLAGLVFILGRFVDAVLDPAMGVISDKFKPHLGRKPFIVWGAVPFGLSFALLWLSPDGSQIIKFLAALAFLTLFSVIY